MNGRRRYRIVIVDDHMIVRRGLRSLLEDEPDFVVVGETGEGETARWLIPQLRPDLALIDIRLSDMTGLELCRALQQYNLPTRLVILTAFLDRDLLHQTLSAGANGYLLKDAENADLVRNLRLVLQGQTVLDQRAVGYVAEYVANHPPKETDPLLTPRELEILRMIAQGMTNGEIADALYVSAATVKDYVRNIITKLEARNRVEAVTIAVRRGLI